MKSKVKVLVFFFTVIVCSGIFTHKLSAQQPAVNFQIFYDELSPFGQWVNYPNWGYVWIPDAGPEFEPYSTDGHWILSEYGWTWASDYSWGWAPFHYGRWDFDHYYGWFWIPDNEWGPAWVNWRRADGYYGWAPMEPGVSISVSFRKGYDSHNDHWVFVRDRDIDRADIHNYYVNQADHDRIVRRSSVISNTYIDRRRHSTYVTGPGRTDIQKVTGRKFSPLAIKEYDRPGQDLNNEHFRIYRPVIQKNNNKEIKVEPSRVTNLNDIKQHSERNVRNQQENSNITNSIRTERRQENTRSQNTDPPQNIRRSEQRDESNQQNINPSQNSRKEQQSNPTKQDRNIRRARRNN